MCAALTTGHCAPGGSRGLPAHADLASSGFSVGVFCSHPTCRWIAPSRDPCPAGTPTAHPPRCSQSTRTSDTRTLIPQTKLSCFAVYGHVL